MNVDEFARMHALEEHHFWFRERRRGLQPWVDGALAAAPPGPLLDLGAGTGRNLVWLRERTVDRAVIGIDQSPDALSHCRSRALPCPLIRSTGQALPFLDHSLALVTALDVLEHVEQEAAALAEIHRCLIPRGELIVTVPAHPALFGPHDRALGHLRRYRRHEVDHKLVAAGFEVLESRAFNSLLLPGVALWRCSRRFTGDSAEASSDVRLVPKFINELLGTFLRWDTSLSELLKELPGLSWWIHARRRS